MLSCLVLVFKIWYFIHKLTRRLPQNSILVLVPIWNHSHVMSKIKKLPSYCSLSEYESRDTFFFPLRERKGALTAHEL